MVNCSASDIRTSPRFRATRLDWIRFLIALLQDIKSIRDVPLLMEGHAFYLTVAMYTCLQHRLHARSFKAAVFWLVESFNGAAAAVHQMSSHAVAITEFSMSRQPFLFVGTRGGRVMH